MITAMKYTSVTQTTVSPIALAEKTGRFNLKLSKAFRNDFQKPYDLFINRLLRFVGEISAEAHADTVRNAIVKSPKGSNWTVWLSDKIRDHFMACKQQVLPNGTHSQFVNILLEIQRVTPDRSSKYSNDLVSEISETKHSCGKEPLLLIEQQKENIARTDEFFGRFLSRQAPPFQLPMKPKIHISAIQHLAPLDLSRTKKPWLITEMLQPCGDPYRLVSF